MQALLGFELNFWDYVTFASFAILGAGFIEELDRNKTKQTCPHCGKEL